MATFRVIGIGENGKYMDDRARIDVLNYCTQESKTTHALIGSMAVNADHAEQEMRILASLYNQDKGLRLRHWVISFEPGELPGLYHADLFAREAIAYYGDRYQIVYSVHEDTGHIHIHIVMNLISYLDGRRYRGQKRDYYGYLSDLNRIAAKFGTYVVPVKDRVACEIFS